MTSEVGIRSSEWTLILVEGLGYALWRAVSLRLESRGKWLSTLPGNYQRRELGNQCICSTCGFVGLVSKSKVYVLGFPVC